MGRRCFVSAQYRFERIVLEMPAHHFVRMQSESCAATQQIGVVTLSLQQHYGRHCLKLSSQFEAVINLEKVGQNMRIHCYLHT